MMKKAAVLALSASLALCGASPLLAQNSGNGAPGAAPNSAPTGSNPGQPAEPMPGRAPAVQAPGAPTVGQGMNTQGNRPTDNAQPQPETPRGNGATGR